MERHKRVTVIINPQANHGRAREVVPVIKRAFPDARNFVTEEAGDAERIAGLIAKSTGVVAVGGDGTVFEIVNGLAAAGKLDVPLGVIPCGSGNDFCKTAGLPLAFDTAVKAVLVGLESGLTRQLDLGCVNGRYYVNSLAAGFDARVAHVANTIKEETQKSGLTLYLTALFRVVFHDFYCHTIRLRLDGGDWEERDVLLVAVNNGYVYGGGFRLHPRPTRPTACSTSVSSTPFPAGRSSGVCPSPSQDVINGCARLTSTRSARRKSRVKRSSPPRSTGSSFTT